MRKRKGLSRKKTVTTPASGNLADDVVAVLSLLNTHPFVQKAFLTKGKAPTVVLYTEQQLVDMKRFCCPQSDGVTRSVLGVDRTFNLGPCYVTVTTGCIV